LESGTVGVGELVKTRRGTMGRAGRRLREKRGHQWVKPKRRKQREAGVGSIPPRKPRAIWTREWKG